ncbi:MAG: prepilin-type N-terminal cleavage/methylation domain-containing protein [Candidatus Pacebacteria bacterium]|nr:prepilin-type N-terminal cleavage/methylation domain-containing protein [Candidatus Paceibacterota bacterium]
MKYNKGFTLVELLIVIAIIGILSSVVLSSLNTARLKARDARRVADFKSVSLAMELYKDSFGAYPGSNALYPDSKAQFDQMAQQLVTAGFLSSVPKDPVDNSTYKYQFYYYGPGGAPGAIIVSYLESVSATTVGPLNSCRPFTTNWCSYTQPSSAYCLCHPY